MKLALRQRVARRHGVDCRDQLRRRPGQSGRNAVPAVSETDQGRRCLQEKRRPHASTRIRTLLVHILGKTGQFQAALDQVTKLIAEQPTALEPRLEECRLRHSWAIDDQNQLLGAQRASEALRSSLDRITGETFGILRSRLHRGRLLSHAGPCSTRTAKGRGSRGREEGPANPSSRPVQQPISMVRTGSRSIATCSTNSTGCKAGLRPARSLKNRRGGSAGTTKPQTDRPPDHPCLIRSCPLPLYFSTWGLYTQPGSGKIHRPTGLRRFSSPKTC